VTGGAAAMHDPNDGDALLGWLQVGLEDEGWRSQARGMGLKQAQQFSWAKCARDTLAVYQTVAEA